MERRTGSFPLLGLECTLVHGHGMVLASKYAMLMYAAAVRVVLAPAVLGHKVLFPVLVLGESHDVHEVVVGGGVVLKPDLAALGDLCSRTTSFQSLDLSSSTGNSAMPLRKLNPFSLTSASHV